MKTDLKNRADISLLVHTFYQKIREDNLLGQIFNDSIPEQEWPKHLEKLTDFWETNLFRTPKFKGNPTQKHLQTNARLGYPISQLHFKQWLQLWSNSIDELFEGDLATRAKMAAFNIAEIQHSVLERNKHINKK